MNAKERKELEEAVYRIKLMPIESVSHPHIEIISEDNCKALRRIIDFIESVLSGEYVRVPDVDDLYKFIQRQILTADEEPPYRALPPIDDNVARQLAATIVAWMKKGEAK